MPKDPEPSHLQRDFTLAAIKAGVRTDGRRLDEARPWALEWVGGEDGGVECRLGKTRCVPARQRDGRACQSLVPARLTSFPSSCPQRLRPGVVVSRPAEIRPAVRRHGHRPL